MTSIQRSIEIKVPVHTLYNQLTQFEEYPRFMQDIESVQQLDDAHLHFTGRLEDRPIEWDAAITEQIPDQCIAWHSTNGPANGGRVELQPFGPDSSRLTFTWESELVPEPAAPAGSVKSEMSERVWADLTRLKEFVENRGGATGSWRGEIHDEQVTMRDRDAADQPGSAASEDKTGPDNNGFEAGGDKARSSEHGAATVNGLAPSDAIQLDRGSPGNPIPPSGYAPVAHGKMDQQHGQASTQTAAEQRNDSAGSVVQSAMLSDTNSNRGQANSSMQSDYSLSQNGEEKASDDAAMGGQFSIAEEVNLDQQSSQARSVGQMPGNDGEADQSDAPHADAIGKAIQQNPDKGTAQQ